MVVCFTDTDGSALPIESEAFVAAQSSRDMADTSVILLSTGGQVQVKEATSEIYKVLLGVQRASK